jgi:hypothetical protein
MKANPYAFAHNSILNTSHYFDNDFTLAALAFLSIYQSFKSRPTRRARQYQSPHIASKTTLQFHEDDVFAVLKGSIFRRVSARISAPSPFDQLTLIPSINYIKFEWLLVNCQPVTTLNSASL